MFTVNNALLLVIDIQGQLAYRMRDKDKLFAHLEGMIKGAEILDVPILWTEQAPEKIGPTVPEVSVFLSHLTPITKTSFSCCGERKFLDALNRAKRRQIIVVGIETHVCVYQTVADLLHLKYEVQVVTDAVSSRTAENRDMGLERIRECGAGLTTTEMILCELLQKAEGEKFKEILQLIK